MKRGTPAIVALLLAVVTLSGCTGNPALDQGAVPSSSTPAPLQQEIEGQGPSYPLTVESFNYAKEPVTFTYQQAPRRVITFWANSLETMLALGLGNNIICTVGVAEEQVLPELQEAFAKCKENIAYHTEVQDTNAALSKEAAVMMEPDFILGWKSSFSDKTIGDVGYWNNRGVGTYMARNANDISEKRTLENEYTDILTIGAIFGVTPKATALVTEMRAEVARVTAATQGQAQKSVLIIEKMKDKIVTYDESTLAGDMVKAMGGKVVSAGREIGAEDLIALDPELLLVIGTKEKAQAVLEEAAYQSLGSVQKGQVYAIDLSEVYTSGVRTIHGLNHIGQYLYPELYAVQQHD